MMLCQISKLVRRRAGSKAIIAKTSRNCLTPFTLSSSSYFSSTLRSFSSILLSLDDEGDELLDGKFVSLRHNNGLPRLRENSGHRPSLSTKEYKCRDFWNTGTCFHGDNCRNLHIAKPEKEERKPVQRRKKII